MDSAGQICVLHIDDDPAIVDLSAEMLHREDNRLTIETATNVDEATTHIATQEFDCIVSDYEMPGQNGIEFLETIRKTHPDLPFILYTGKGSEAVAADAISAGVTDYLQKEAGTEQYALLANRILNAVSAHRAKVGIERSEHRLSQILKTVPSCVVQLDYEGNFVFANDRAVAVLGLDIATLTDRTYRDPEWRITDLDGNPIPDAELPFRQVRDSGEPVYGYRHLIEWPDGSRKILSVNGAPLFDDDGAVESVVCSLTDITDEREHEKALERVSPRLTALFENGPDMINVHDGDGNIIDPNPRLCDETGYTAAELTEMKVWDVDRSIAPDEARALWADMEHGDRERLDGVYQRRDGSTFPVEVRIRYLEQEGQDRYLVSSREITERKTDEQKRQQVIDRMSDAVIAVDTDWDITLVNSRMEAVSGRDESALVGRPLWDVFPDAEDTRFEATFRDAMRTRDRASVVDYSSAMAEWLDIDIYPNDDGGLAFYLQVITDHKEHEAELTRERDRLEEFAGVISHDIRNPLNVAHGRLEVVQAEYDNEHFDVIEQALRRIDRITEEVLWLAREGRDRGSLDAVAVQKLVDDAWHMVGEGAEQATVQYADGDFSSMTIEADVDQFSRLLENLLGNAIDHGGDDVTVTVGAMDGGFYIEDDGPGIPAAHRDDIFAAGYSTSDDGTGFGLTIVTRVAEAHDWTVHMTESAAGGARFEITDVEHLS